MVSFAHRMREWTGLRTRSCGFVAPGKGCGSIHCFVWMLGLLSVALPLSGFPSTFCAEPGRQDAAAADPSSSAIRTIAASAHGAPTDDEIERLIKKGLATEVHVDRVVVPAVVLDRKGRPVQGLRVEDFAVAEESIPQRIDYFFVERNEPVSIAFLLDVSGSMRLLDKIGEAREAITFFLDKLGPRDEAQLMTFADNEVETMAPFGTAPDLIRQRLEDVKAYGQTALNDAIAAAPGILERDRKGRKAIVLITDGVDNYSKFTLMEAVASARKTDVPVYAIGFAQEPRALKEPAGEGETNAGVLQRVADETGGRFFFIHDPDDMKEAIQAIEDDLSSQYVLGYTPARMVCDGSFRRIQLSVGKDRYRVRTRKGYVAGPC